VYPGQLPLRDGVTRSCRLMVWQGGQLLARSARGSLQCLDSVGWPAESAVGSPHLFSSFCSAESVAGIERSWEGAAVIPGWCFPADIRALLAVGVVRGLRVAGLGPGLPGEWVVCLIAL
jgi:hypothetical protein